MDAWWYTWLPLLLLFLFWYFRRKKLRKIAAATYIKMKKEKKIMEELAKRYIGKDCYINLLDGTVDGVLTEVTDGGIVVEKDGKPQAVNLDFVMKISEYPYNKKGKRSAIVG